MADWIKVAESYAELFSANPVRRKVNGKLICFAQHNGDAYAFPDSCPHAGGSLSCGEIDNAGNIICPLHRYKFTMKNGYNSSGEGYYLKRYELKDDDGIWCKL